MRGFLLVLCWLYASSLRLDPGAGELFLEFSFWLSLVVVRTNWPSRVIGSVDTRANLSNVKIDELIQGVADTTTMFGGGKFMVLRLPSVEACNGGPW